MLLSSRVRVRVWVRFSVRLVSDYAHVFVLLSVVIVALPLNTNSLSNLTVFFNPCVSVFPSYLSCFI